MTRSILDQPDTRMTVARAEKLSILVDGADYFRTAKAAMVAAEHRVYLVGWDFDARIELEPGGATIEGPNTVGAFFTWLKDSRPHLDVRILKWDIGILRALGRGETPAFLIFWLMPRGIDFRLDFTHPTTSAHHMKLLVVDDALAFCGGIDMTMGRWDTPDHPEQSPARRTPRGKALPPWHDVTSCMTGPAAKAIAAVAAQRWYWATDEETEALPPVPAPWPDGLVPDFEDVDIGVARTVPRHGKREPVNEILAATYALIRAARRTLYIESQYLASRVVCEAIAERLEEADGPEVVIINPLTADGWLEAKAMDTARVRMLRLLRDADVDGRLRVYHPVTAAGTSIYVHAKIMFADEHALKVGSANLNNRSMGYDSECDIIVEATGEGAAQTAARIAAVRDRLIGEHLGVSPDEVAATFAERGSLIATIEALNRPDRHHLKPLEPRELWFAEELFAESDAADPIRPVGLRRVLLTLLRRAPVRRFRRYRQRRRARREAQAS